MGLKSIVFLCILTEVRSKCPVLKDSNKKESLKNIRLSVLTLYQYLPVDPQINSPFHVSEVITRSMTVQVNDNIRTFSSTCMYNDLDFNQGDQDTIPREGVIVHKLVDLMDEDSDMYKLEYKKDLLSCDSKYKMQEIYLIDFDNNGNFISYYGCQLMNIDGNLKKN